MQFPPTNIDLWIVGLARQVQLGSLDGASGLPPLGNQRLGGQDRAGAWLACGGSGGVCLAFDTTTGLGE